MDLLREIILFLANCNDHIYSYSIELPGCDSDAIAYHCILLRDQGLIDSPEEWDISANTRYPNITIKWLTSPGQDLLSQITDTNKWAVAKSLMLFAKQWTLPVLVEKLKEMTAAGWDQYMEPIAKFLETQSQQLFLQCNLSMS